MLQLDLNRNFPMPDAESAQLMMLKAECLLAARAISEAEKSTIVARAMAALEQPCAPCAA
jgi:hypothetical protein